MCRGFYLFFGRKIVVKEGKLAMLTKINIISIEKYISNCKFDQNL